MLTFEVTVEEGNLILAGLSELPVKVAYPLIQKLQQQAAPQIAAKTQETANG